MNMVKNQSRKFGCIRPLSKLNFHKFKHNFRDAVNPMCPSSDGIEDAEHFLLLCPSFDAQRRDLLAGFYDVLRPF